MCMRVSGKLVLFCESLTFKKSINSNELYGSPIKLIDSLNMFVLKNPL